MPFFGGLNSAEMEAMRPSFEMETIRPGTDLIQFSQLNDKVFFLLSSPIRIYIQKDEKSEVVLAILGPDEVLGEISGLDALAVSVSLMTAEECQLISIRDTNSFGRSSGIRRSR